MLKEAQLQKMAEENARKLWGLELDIPIKVSGRIKKAQGRFMYRTDGVALKIEVSKMLLENSSHEHIEKVLNHELCHWALHKKGEPFKDGHPHFESEIRRIGSISTKGRNFDGYKHVIVCDKCKKIALHKNNTNGIQNKLAHFVSKCCGATLKYLGYMEFRNGVMTGNKKEKQKAEITHDMGIVEMKMALIDAIDNNDWKTVLMIHQKNTETFFKALGYVGKKRLEKIIKVLK